MRDRILLKLTILVFASVALSCSDTTIDPFENDGNYFTVYGFLDDLENTHALRVIPVTRRVENIQSPNDDQRIIDAVVYTTDMSTGVRTKWTHKLEQLSDGSYGHIFRASFLVSAQKRYKLEIIRSDGKMTTATTKVPYFGQENLYELGPEVISEDSSHVYRDIKIPNVPSPWEIQSKYFWAPDVGNDLWVFVPKGRSGHRTEDGGWQIRVDISADQENVRESVQEAKNLNWIAEDAAIALVAMGLQIRILDEGWDPPNGIFDPETLAQPGRLSNVENGYGYFGSVGLYIREWDISHLSVLLGYDF